MNLSKGTILGALVEHLAPLRIHTYAEAAEARVGHLRTRSNDHEVDLIVQHAKGRVLGVEVKLATGWRTCTGCTIGSARN